MATEEGGLIYSRREAARQLGLTEGALRFAEKAGRIAPEPGGGYDMARVRAGMSNTADPARRREAQLGPDTAPAAAPRPAWTERTTVPGATPEPNRATPPRPSGMTFADARTAHEVLKVQERRIRLDERRGRLVEKSKAVLLVRKLAVEERDSILGWPARVAAVLAAELGVDAHRLQTLLDASLRDYLRERHDVRFSLG